MNTLRRAAIAAALTTVFSTPAAAEKRGDPEMPAVACAPYLQTGADERECGRSLRHWADVYAREQEDHITNEQGNKPLPSLRELSYLGDIRSSCETVRGMYNSTPLADTVLATDQCLRRAYEYGQIGGTNTIGIVQVGETLQQVGKALEERLLPSPKQACADYLSGGLDGKACAQSIAYATMQLSADLSAHAGPQADALVQTCLMLGKAAETMPVGYVTAMAIKCLDEATNIAVNSGYKDMASIEALQNIVGEVGLASIGRPKPRDLPQGIAP